jgi:Subtilisin inhibitor-like
MAIRSLPELLLVPAALLALVAGAGTAQAAPGSPSFILTIHNGEDVSGPVLAQVTLTCEPPGGTHPNPVAACRALQSVGYDFSLLPPARGQFCPEIFQPVTVEAKAPTGLKDLFVKTYPNRCFAAVDTDDVFAF